MILFLRDSGLTLSSRSSTSLFVRSSTPKNETDFIAATIAPAKERIRSSDEDLESFLNYAVKVGGADRLNFPGRIAKLFRNEPPTAYVVALLLRWHAENPPPHTEKRASE